MKMYTKLSLVEDPTSLVRCIIANTFQVGRSGYKIQLDTVSLIIKEVLLFWSVQSYEYL